MSSASQERTPVVLLVFANDRYDGGVGGYLRHLAREDTEIRNALKPAVSAGHCVLVRDTSITHTELFDLLDDHGRDIVGLHFGGHADPQGLQLIDEEGASTPAHIEGIAQRLGNLPALRWMFLNGCGTAAHIEVLHRYAPVPLVATSSAVRDDAAVMFARRFYKGLAAQQTIIEAFENAHSELRSQHATAADAMRSGGADSLAGFRMLAPAEDTDEWPWVLALPPGNLGLERRYLVEIRYTDTMGQVDPGGETSKGPPAARVSSEPVRGEPTVDLRGPALDDVDATVDGHGRRAPDSGTLDLRGERSIPLDGDLTLEAGPRDEEPTIERRWGDETIERRRGDETIADPTFLDDAPPSEGLRDAALRDMTLLDVTLDGEFSVEDVQDAGPQSGPRRTTELPRVDNTSSLGAFWKMLRVMLVPPLVVMSVLLVAGVIVFGVVGGGGLDAGVSAEAGVAPRARDAGAPVDAQPVDARAVDAAVIDVAPLDAAADAVSRSAAHDRTAEIERLSAELDAVLRRCGCREARRLGVAIEGLGGRPTEQLERLCRPRRGARGPGLCGVTLGQYLDRAIARCPCDDKARYLVDTLESVYEVDRTREVSRRCWAPGAAGACR